MAAYVYRDQLLDALTPLLQLLEVEPRQLQGLRLQPYGLELDMLPPTIDGGEPGFKYVQIADRHEDQELASEPAAQS